MQIPSKTVMDAIFEMADMRCTICNAKAGTCDCWTRCRCGWTYRTGEKCNNPVHKRPEPPKD